MIAYHRPTTLTEALAIRAGQDVTVLAGGTDVYPAKATRAAWGDPAHKPVLDISGLPGMRGVIEHDNHWRIGALTTWTDLIRAPLPPLFDALKGAAREVGGAQIQNRGTIAGNICTASPAGDGIPCLLALEAEVELSSQSGRRLVPIDAFNIGYRRTACRQDEIVTALRVPRREDCARSHFLKLGARAHLVISIVMVALLVEIDDGGHIMRARIAVGSCSAAAQRLHTLEALLAGQRLVEAAQLVSPLQFADLAPLDDIRSSAAHRLSAAATLVRDGLAHLAGQTRSLTDA